MEQFAVWIAFIIAILNCFIAANNVALNHFSLSRLEERLVKRGHEARLSFFTRQRRKLLLFTAITRAVCNLLIVMFLMAAFEPLQKESYLLGLLTVFLSASVIIIIFGNGIPASWGRYAAESLLIFSYGLLKLGLVVFQPLFIIMHWIDPLVRRLLGVSEKQWKEMTNIEQDILDAVSHGEKSGLVDERQADMIEAIVDFPNTSVDQIMMPRTEVEGIPVNSTLQETKEIIAKAGHSRMPVYEDNLDTIVGILYAKDLLALLGNVDADDFDLRKLVRQPWFVPETILLKDLLPEFRQRKVHMALVLDEYGGTAGLVTVEDIIEEIVGDIQDEYEPDEEDYHIERVDERSILVDGRYYIDDLNDELNTQIPENEDYDTIAGFAFANFGHIPNAGESFTYEDVTVEVIDAEKTKINRLKLTFDHELPSPPQPDTETASTT